MAKQIPLTKGKFAIVDDEDFEELNKYKWQAELRNGRKVWYAVTHIWTGEYKTNDKGWKIKIRKKVRMHNFIMKELGIDHIDGDGLNNTRANLRKATNTQNQFNKSKRNDNTTGYKNVFYNKNSGKFLAKLQVNRSVISLGEYKDKELAYYAVCKKMIELHGEYVHNDVLEWVKEYERINESKLDDINRYINNKIDGLRDNNTSGYPHVYFNKKMNKYFSRVIVNGKSKVVKYSNDPKECHEARLKYISDNNI